MKEKSDEYDRSIQTVPFEMFVQNPLKFSQDVSTLSSNLSNSQVLDDKSQTLKISFVIYFLAQSREHCGADNSFS